MITGDSELTAANVNDQLDIGPKAHIFLNLAENNKIVWLDDDGDKKEDYNEKNLDSLQKNFTLCITGSVLKFLTVNKTTSEISQLIKSITVFARVSPSQKVIKKKNIFFRINLN